MHTCYDKPNGSPWWRRVPLCICHQDPRPWQGSRPCPNQSLRWTICSHAGCSCHLAEGQPQSLCLWLKEMQGVIIGEWQQEKPLHTDLHQSLLFARSSTDQTSRIALDHDWWDVARRGRSELNHSEPAEITKKEQVTKTNLEVRVKPSLKPFGEVQDH